MTWAKIKSQKEIDRSDPKAVFSEMKSKSFWSWHDTGMTGPESVSQRLRMQKKERKAKEPLNLSAMHPVSALGELCQKRGWKEPFYKTEQPPSAGFLLSVIVHNQSFSPAEPSVTKKEAKSAVALLALQELGLLPKE